MRFSLIMVLASAFMSMPAFASSETDARAYVDVAIAIVLAADDHAELPDTTPRYRATATVRAAKNERDELTLERDDLELSLETNAKEFDKVVSEKEKLNRLVDELRKKNEAIKGDAPLPPTPIDEGLFQPMKAGPRSASDATAVAEYRSRLWKNFGVNGFSAAYGDSPVLKLDVPAAAKSASGPVELTFYTGENQHGVGWCSACPTYSNAYGTGNSQLRIIHSKDVAPGDQTYPALRFNVDGKPRMLSQILNGNVVAYRPATLDELTNLVIRESGGGDMVAGARAPTGKAGTIRIRSQVQDARHSIRQYMPSGEAFLVEWWRTGVNQISLIHNTNWSAAAICGTSGRFRISAKNSKLPVDEAGFTYQVIGSDIRFQSDQITVKGLADLLNPANKNVPNAQPAGVLGIDDAFLAYQVFSIVKGIASILWPSMDLMLPNKLTMSIRLDGENIVVDFVDAPTVKIVMLFTFNLGIRQVIFNDENTHVEFSGSQWVKSRDFNVVE